MALSDLLGTRDAARSAGVPTSTFQSAVERGELPYFVIGVARTRYFDPEDVETWAEQRRQDGRTAPAGGNLREVAA